MFADVKAVKRLMKSAYKGTGITIENQYDGMAIYTSCWGVWITNEDLTNEIKAAVVEIAGELPEDEEAWSCRYKEENQQVIPKSLYDMEKIITVASISQKAHITPILYMKDDGTLCRALQGVEKVERYEDVGEKSMFGNIALINNVFADWIDVTNIRAEEKEEEWPSGPRMSLENGIVVWNNERCVMHCRLRDDTKEREDGIIDILERRTW